MNANQLRHLVKRTLIALNLYSPQALELILGTIAQESQNGLYIKQVGGPALGICQMEPATYSDILENYLKYKPELLERILTASGVAEPKVQYLEYNLVFAIALCRVHYLRITETIPPTLYGWALYWKRYYNTSLGKGTEAEFIKNYKRYVAI